MTGNYCIFCNVIAGKLPSTIIYEDSQALVIQDINPKAPIHYLIIPKQHIASIQELTLKDQKLAGHLLLLAKKIAKITPDASDFRLVINNGKKVGQLVFHLHIHFLAGKRFKHDTDL
jgi:histidine triad (HIT) family protein